MSRGFRPRNPDVGELRVVGPVFKRIKKPRPKYCSLSNKFEGPPRSTDGGVIPFMHCIGPAREEPAAGRMCLEDVLLEVPEAHTLIAECWGPEHELDGLQFPDLYVFRSSSRRVFELSYYDVHWLRKWSWMCGCSGRFQHGCGCSMTWRKRGWNCPIVLQYL